MMLFNFVLYYQKLSVYIVYLFFFVISNIKANLQLLFDLMDWKNKPHQIFNKIKAQMFAKGVQNFYALDKFIQQFDPEYSGVLNPHLFNLFCNKVGFFLTTQQIRTITELYAKQDKQKIHYRQFLQDIKYSLSEKIINLINQAFDKLVGKSSQSNVSLQVLRSFYRAEKHPKVVTRMKTIEQSYEIFMKGMQRKAKNGWISKQGFVDYYAQLNFCLPQQRQTYFKDILISTWGLDHSEDYVSQQRIREIQLILYEKIRQKSDGKTNQWKTGKKALAYFDLKDYGRCDYKEFKKGLDKFGCSFKDNQIKALFNKHDKNQQGYLNYQEFSKTIMDMDISGLATKSNLFQQTMGKNHFTLTK